jgi:hypothetical protein
MIERIEFPSDNASAGIKAPPAETINLFELNAIIALVRYVAVEQYSSPEAVGAIVEMEFSVNQGGRTVAQRF